MKEFDRVKDGDEYMYTIDGEPALWGDEEAFGLIRDWENATMIVKSLQTCRCLKRMTELLMNIM